MFISRWKRDKGDLSLAGDVYLARTLMTDCMTSERSGLAWVLIGLETFPLFP